MDLIQNKTIRSKEYTPGSNAGGVFRVPFFHS